MKLLVELTKAILVAILITFFCFDGTNQQGAPVQPHKKNKVFVERLICKNYPGSKVQIVNCTVKYVDRDNVKIFVAMNFTDTLRDIWYRAKWYQKFFTYDRIAGEMNENLCDFFRGKSNFIINFFMRELVQHSNINHSCPYYPGLYYAKVDKYNIQKIAFPQILPALRFRVDFNLTDPDRSKVHFGGSVYFSISDHRVEIV